MYPQDPSGQEPQQGGPYPSQGWQQPPQGWQQPPQKRKAWPWVLLGCGVSALLVLVLGVACVAVVSSGSPEETSGADPGEGSEGGTGEAEETVGMGEPGTVGQWEVTVDDIETSTTYGDEFSTEEAQGEFKLVSLTVENIGEEATTFDESGVYLIEDDGNRHSSTTTLAEDSLFLEQINPGNEVSGTAVVDVPEGTEIDSVEIEDIGSLEGPLVIEMP